MSITSETPTIATRLEDEEREALEALAKENDRSVAAELRRAVRFYLRAQAQGEAA